MKRRQATKRSMQTSKWMRIACVVFVFIFILQAYLVKIGSLSQHYYISDTVFWVLVSSALILTASVLLYSRANLPKPAAFARAIGLELVGIGFIITSTGFGSLLSLALLFVLYESYIIYKLRGVVISVAILVLAIAYEIYKSTEFGTADILKTLIALATIFAIVVIGAVILQIQSVRHETLEKSRAQANLERYRISTLMNSLAEGVLSVDNKGVVRMYNAATLGILDTNGSLNGQYLDEVFKVRNEQGKQLHIFSLMQHVHQAEVFDNLYYHYGDEVARLEVSVTPVRAGRHHGKLDIDQGFILLVRDITKQKNLDDERDEFISVVSHELRTPLAVAEGSLGNIKTIYEKGLATPARVRPVLEAAHEQIVFLSRMANDLSTLSRAEHAEPDEAELINVNQLLRDLYTEHLPIVGSAGLQLNIDVAHDVGIVRVSPLYITELLHNLIDNAVKYTKSGSITLSALRKGATITIAVTDTGIGMSRADKDKAFDKFYRSEDYRTRETRGTGLGLYVSTKLAAKLKTTIQLKSRFNHGSSFSITLDAATPEK